MEPKLARWFGQSASNDGIGGVASVLYVSEDQAEHLSYLYLRVLCKQISAANTNRCATANVRIRSRKTCFEGAFFFYIVCSIAGSG